MEWLEYLYKEYVIGNLEIYFKIFISAILGMIIGWDRSSKNKPAGLKTFTYVAVSCTLITIVSIDSAEVFGSSNMNNRMDPMRLSAQIVSGLGFLGAGLIIKDGFRVKGLTSAAMVFFAGGVGIGIGAGFYALIFFTVIITLAIVKIENMIELRDAKSRKHRIKRIKQEQNMGG